MNKFSYLPNTEADRKAMLDTLGIDSVEALFSDIPEKARFQGELNLPKRLSEMELNRYFNRLAGKNDNLEDNLNFLGAGAYQHYIPSVVDAIISRSEFFTAYTPYQPEISQGVLQAIFEYQTVVCELTGMEVANASLYDGPTAFGEAAYMSCAATRRNKVLVARSVNPEYREVLKTYAYGQNIEVVEVGIENGLIDLNDLASKLDDTVAGLFVQYPNFFGSIEDLRNLADLAHAQKALFVVSVNPIALGLLETPGACGADIVVGEGQVLGNPISYGGPYLGMLATTKEQMRRIPGRVVGQTTDIDGRRAFVLTLQAREQHIRREKATSNICSNQALNALAATVYVSYMGKQGMQAVAKQNLQKAHYAQKRLAALPQVKVLFTAPFFNEFAIQLDADLTYVNRQLLEAGIIGGYDLGTTYPEYENCMLLAVTELRTKEDIDLLVERLEAIL
ncbi:aminomethyl-transferring glycine dehydrogenase subunit GcvPA [Tumebacillus permanentifrigoris]|uniref:Probable glycine dehydrogenase (decarboxylating) subunit 1 n=1 Tax=Tumebacillus permanentifrigoris TaxID=378543 RepID=A0A316D3U9_9BACL|nr:aminomethyl-transferring glycine dehydrogenase subunit GcvPA [Tumebacillus permanentifrigoris]PWK06302.1 glycine cleavage system pyridoxal-binding protein P [Tumebacillus permanentifrigoris]